MSNSATVTSGTARHALDDLYRQLLVDLLASGQRRKDRTGTGTWALFGRTLELDLREGFPLLGLRKLSFRTVLLEQLWMLKGKPDTKWLLDQDVRIWLPWTTEDGHIGPTVGQHWRSWQTPGGGQIDQVLSLIEGLRTRPHSRRHLLSAWNVANLPNERQSPVENVREGKMALAPCLVTHQFYVEDGHLSVMVHQRSADAFLGLPHDIAGSALLVAMFARLLQLRPHRLIVALGDVHLYSNHRDQALQLVQRESRLAPRLVFHTSPKNPFEYNEGEIALKEYDPHPPVSAPIAV